jgi:hypothetical protein
MKLIPLCILLIILSCGQTRRENNSQIIQKDLTNLKANSDSGIALDFLPDSAFQNQIIQTESMNTARAAHTSTLLNNGKVLICGGFAGNNNFISSVEIYDPALNSFRQVGDMAVPRLSHSATLLPDGKVLIAGGYDGSYLSSTEIFDPQSETFTHGSDMKTARMGHTATILNNGKILFAGGVGTGWTFLESAEVYDMDSKSFSLTGSMNYARESHTATFLTNGTVLISGGHKGRRADIQIYSSAEIYNPSTGQFTETANMNIIRHKHDAVLLADGTVLITGGSDEKDYAGVYKSSEIYYPDLRIFKTSGNMNLPRFKHYGTSVLLPDGNVLVAGGTVHAEIFNAVNNQFEIVEGNLKGKWYFSSTTLLQNENVLITGGYDENIITGNNAWIYRYTNR